MVMRTLIVLLSVVLNSCADLNIRSNGHPIQDRAVIFSVDDDSFFGVHAFADGNMNIIGNTLDIALTNIRFKANPKYDYLQRVQSYTVCVAYDMNTRGNWNLSKCDRLAYVNAVIESGETQLMPDRTFSIRGVSKLDDRWLILLLNKVNESNYVTGTFYSHSQKGIFQKNPEPSIPPGDPAQESAPGD